MVNHKNILAQKILAGVCVFLSLNGLLSPTVFAEDVSLGDTGYHQATSHGGNNSTIYTTGTGSSDAIYKRNDGDQTQTINEGNDSSTIGNYFKGYYYDSALGFFKLDWSTNASENVRVVDSTDKCLTQNGLSGYGYKIGGYAYSQNAGFVKFNHSDEIFVYFCEGDGKLHGYAYGENTGLQSFEGIPINISGTSTLLTTTTTPTTGTTADPFFVNNTTFITSDSSGIYLTQTPTIFQDDIQWESLTMDPEDEIYFYVVK